ncbi:MAG: tetratricopeptide repeat protein [Pyrinomonadaceae bacterium]
MLIFIFHATGSPQNRSTIGGHVFDSKRTPIADVFVELQNEVNSVLARTKTDGSGRYIFRNLSGGRFYVRVLPFKSNLAEQIQEVEVVEISFSGRPQPENVQRDFYLRPRGSERNEAQITGVVFAQEVPAEAQKHFKNALESFDKEKVDEGIKELYKAIAAFPEYFAALDRLGSELIKRQQFSDASSILQRAVTVNSKGFSSWYGLSYSLYAQQSSNEAIAAATKATSLNPKSSQAWLILGVSYRLGKDYEKAEKALKTAAKLGAGKFADAHWNLALLYAHNLKRFEEAAIELERYLRAAPDAANADSVEKLIKKFRDTASRN